MSAMPTPPEGAEFVAARVRVTVDCPECASAIPVNGIADQVLCGACQAVVRLEGNLSWERILTYQSGEGCMEHNILVNSSKKKAMQYFLAFGKKGGALYRKHRGILLEIDAEPPRCHACGEGIAVQRLADAVTEAGLGAKVFCGACGERFPLRMARGQDPHTIHPNVWAIAGETALKGDLSEPTSDETVLFSCMGCGAPLSIDGSSPRIMKCGFCPATNYLPDALWLRLHPAQRKRAFHFVMVSTPKIHKRARAGL